MIYFARKIIWKSKAFRDIRKLYLEFSGNIIVFCFLYPKIKKIYSLLEDKNYQQAINIAQKLVDSGYLIGLFYKAKIYYLYGQDEEAKVVLEAYLEKQKNHAAAIYLYAEVLFFLKKDSLAWDTLIKFIPNSRRGKTWQVLAKFVTTTQRFNMYKLMLYEKYKVPPEKLPISLLEHLTYAAFKCGRQDEMVPFWKEKYNQINAQYRLLYKPNFIFKRNAAEQALKDLKSILDSKNIIFFLISGTLLGCIREGHLLKHDKDIDIGVWDTITAESLISIIRLKGCFYILPSSTKELVVVRHLNGVSIDIFIHKKIDGYVEHFGTKCIWRNKHFTLSDYKFMDDIYKVPENYEFYLWENYGDDWREPKTDFDSVLDTPNVVTSDKSLMIIYLYKKLMQKNNNIDMDRYKSAIKRLMK